MKILIIFASDNINEELAPHCRTSEYAGNKFSTITEHQEKATKKLKASDKNVDAIVVYGEWIERERSDFAEILEDQLQFTDTVILAEVE